MGVCGRVHLEGERAFLLVWVGQLLSTLGTNALVFALAIVAFQGEGQALGLVTVLLGRFLPQLVLSPIAGVVADRFPRRSVILASDAGAAVATAVLLVLLLPAGELGVGAYALYAAVVGTCESFQQPAYLASVAMLVRKRNFGRAAGMLSLVDSAPHAAAPLLAGALLPLVGLVGLAVIELLTFTVAVGILLAVRFREPERPVIPAGVAWWRSWAADAWFGFGYILRRRGLLGLLVTFSGVNLLIGLGGGLTLVIVLARTGGDEAAVGLVQGVGALGGVLGGILMSTWGGPRRRILGVLGGAVSLALSGRVLFAVSSSVPAWAASRAASNLFLPLVNGSNQAIWQVKVDPAQQGRVFGARRVFAQVTYPVGLLGAGLLVDDVFEPGVAAGTGWLWEAGQAILGGGAGTGAALLMGLTGILGVFVPLVAWAVPSIREVERRLPDAVPEEVEADVSSR